jgi:hypothetical protein
LGLPLPTLHNWKTKSKAGKIKDTADYNPDLAAIYAESCMNLPKLECLQKTDRITICIIAYHC